MEKIASFTIDHNRLKRGIYLSRLDRVGPSSFPISTFDIRVKEPNREPVIDVPALHTMEHLGATFLRGSVEWKERIIYFGPMGCRTGFYLIVSGECSSEEISPLVKDMCLFISNYTGSIPGAEAKECGNYLNQDLPMAKWEADKFLNETLSSLKRENLIYPNSK